MAMADSAHSSLKDVRNVKASTTKPWRKQRKPRAVSVRLPIADQPLSTQDCVICGRPGCSLVTHRLATLHFLKRSSKTNKKSCDEQPAHSSSTQPVTYVDPHQRGLPLSRSPNAFENLIDPFTPFPVPGASKDTMRQFHDFFSQQGGFVTDPDRHLVFERRNFPALYSAGMRNPALCMSIVAMAASYNAVHHRNRATPDVETLLVYSQTFEIIRAQIEEEQKTQVTEPTIQAVLQMTMGSGIGFGDAAASIIHWNGVVALLDKYPHFRLSGWISSYVTQMEYWLAIYPGLKPQANEWPVLLPNPRSPPERYGQDLEQLFDLPSMWSQVSPKLLSVALTTCRATEILETAAAAGNKHSQHATPPYFMHLFDVLLRQHAQLYTTLMHRNDAVECVCIALNVYFMLVIRRTPWRAPLAHACSRLRDCLTMCEVDFELEAATTVSGNTMSTANEEEDEMMNNLYLCMMILCACASQLCRDQQCLDWTVTSLRPMCQDDLDLTAESGKSEVLRRIRRLCWSDTFLSKQFEELCSLLGRKKSEI